ncbi:MAG: hypothetical protein ACOZQL_10040 [Myxococcota bacterium]
MELVFEIPDRVRLERDAARGIYLARWSSLCGPHYRAACAALLDDAKARGGLSVYVSDPHEAHDVQTQDDLVFAGEVVKRLIALGCKRFVVVSPQSAVTKLATNRMGKVVDAEGVERLMAPTLEDALRLAGEVRHDEHG